jgi:hypothetical protein
LFPSCSFMDTSFLLSRSLFPSTHLDFLLSFIYLSFPTFLLLRILLDGPQLYNFAWPRCGSNTSRKTVAHEVQAQEGNRKQHAGKTSNPPAVIETGFSPGSKPSLGPVRPKSAPAARCRCRGSSERFISGSRWARSTSRTR